MAADASAAAGFAPGVRVRIQGLGARPELNGTVAVVLAADSDEEARQLEEAGRVKVSCYPKPLSLRPASLAPAGEPDFESGAPVVVLEVVRRSPRVAELCRAAEAEGHDFGGLGLVADLDDPEELAEALWRIFTRGAPLAPAGALPESLEGLVLDTPGHWLYWLGLEQVAHHIVIEACDGVWRGYQAMARAKASEDAEKAFEAFGGVLLEGSKGRKARGFTAGDWASEGGVAACCPEGGEAEEGARGGGDGGAEAADGEEDDPPTGEDDGGGDGGRAGRPPSARALWGAGRDLGREEVAKVLGLVRSLQEQAQKVAAHLREQTGAAAGDDDAARAWAEARLAAGCAAYSVQPDRPTSGARSAPGYAESDLVWIFSPPDARPRCDLSLPPALAFPFMRAFARLAGEYPDGRVFLSLLAFVGWEGLEREDGGCAGWTFRALDRRRSEQG